MPRKPTIPATCGHCGIAFLALSDNVKKGHGKYCSRKCSAQARSVRAIVALKQRFSAKVAPEKECWRWQGSLNNRGYGTLTVRRRTVLAHRVAYELYVGAVPDDLQLDHLCHNRWCVNPAHLEPVTQRENTLRGFAFRRHAASEAA